MQKEAMAGKIIYIYMTFLAATLCLFILDSYSLVVLYQAVTKSYNKRMSNLPPPVYEEDENAPPPYTFDVKQPIESENFEESFKIDRPRYNDVPFTLIFIACSVIFVLLFGHAVSSVNLSGASESNTTFGTFSEIAIQGTQTSIGFFIATGIFLPIIGSVLSLLLAFSFPNAFVFTSYLLFPVSITFSCIAFLASGQFLMAFMCAIFVGLSVFFVCFNMNRLRFTAAMLKIVIKVMAQYPSTLVVAFFSTIISGGLSFVYFVMSMVIYYYRNQQDEDQCDVVLSNGGRDSDMCVSNTTFVVDIYTLFYGYFLFEILANLTHVIISGIYGTWYFFGSKSVQPKNPAMGSLKRAFTFSFGSICFGSLIVAGVRTLRVLISIAKSKAEERRNGNRGGGSRFDQIADRDDNGTSKALLCALIIVLSILEWIATQVEAWARFFNKYAYSYLSLYGKSYLQSARDTFEIFKYKGIMVLISDSLMETTLTFYSIIISVFSCLLMSIYVLSGGFEKGIDNSFLVVGLIFEFAVSYFVSKVTMAVIRSGFITFLVALSINPEVYETEHPEDFNKIVQYHPEIYSSLKTPFPETV